MPTIKELLIVNNKTLLSLDKTISKLSILEEIYIIYNFKIIHCANCGIPIVFTETVLARRKKDKKSFQCSSGHSQSFNY